MHKPVVFAQAGIHSDVNLSSSAWIPACAKTTVTLFFAHILRKSYIGILTSIHCYINSS
jgi:hypothetical protein